MELNRTFIGMCSFEKLYAHDFISISQQVPKTQLPIFTAALQRHGVALYRTDKQGEVTVYSDGENCWFGTSPCEDWTPGSQTAPDTPLAAAPPQSTRYVLNTHTRKFHYPDCPSVEQMSDKNKDFTDATREELIGRGYTPCSRCDP